MRYCTLADLLVAIPHRTLVALSNDDPCAVDPDSNVVNEAINQAEELIDGHLRGRYTLPLNPVPTLLKQYTVALARHWLYARRPEGNDLPDAVTRLHKDAMRGLELIQTGKLHLGSQTTGVDTPDAGEMRVRAKPRVFNDDLMSRY